MIDVSDNDAVYYYHFDGLGSVAALSDANGDMVERYSYGIFGEPNGVSAVGNPYMFTGRRYDDETGLYYYRARYYDPYIGRFLQTDPIRYRDGLNLYTYVDNNPVNFVDPHGLKKKPDEVHGCQNHEKCRKIGGIYICPPQDDMDSCQGCCFYLRDKYDKDRPPWWRLKKRCKHWLNRDRRMRNCIFGCAGLTPIF